MSKLRDMVSPETIASANRFIARIRNNVYTKQILPNSCEDFPVEKAFESGKAFLKSDAFRKLR